MSVAFLVELTNRECVFRCPEEQFERGDFVLKETAQCCKVSHHAAVEYSHLTLHL